MSTIQAFDRSLSTRGRPRVMAAERRWVRPALIALLVLTAVAYLWDLGASGNANSFYAAAVEAGTRSWKAFFFGSLDSSSFITTDKPPASIWVMALSGRIFGFSSWSMLVPQALEGVAAVGLLYAAVKRWFGPAAGIAAGAMLALTPVAALMFRFNNPDALLVAALVASAYSLTRALESASTRWLVTTGALIGFAFLAKMGQAFLVVPAFGLVYLLAGPTSVRRRIGGLLAGFAAMIVSGGWWVAIVALLPSSSRPFIDGSPDNNIFNLIFGYNGFQRLFGSGGSGGSATGLGGGGGANFSGATGTLRLFNDLMGGQASWLLPAALIALITGLWITRSAPRTDRSRAALLLWGGWLIVTAAVFSYSQGVIHTYYTVALAPAVAALVAIGGALLWQRRAAISARAAAAVAVALTGGWSFALLDRTPAWEPWVRVVVLVATVVAVAGLLCGPRLRRLGRRSAPIAAAAVVIAGLGGPAAYAVQTVTSTHSGSTPSAGPVVTVAAAGLGGLRAGPAGAPGGAHTGGAGQGQGLFGPTPDAATPAARPQGGARASADDVPTAGAGGFVGRRPAGAGGFGAIAGAGGAGNAKVATTLVKPLEYDAASYRWVAATMGSTNAAAYELATRGDPVMAIGGFNNNGGLLSLAQFIRYVQAGDIHYYIASGGGGGGAPGGGQSSSSTQEISSWVAAHYRAQTIGGVTVYDLTK